MMSQSKGRHHNTFSINWDIILGMSGASSWTCLGQSKISAVLHASLMPFFDVDKLITGIEQNVDKPIEECKQ